MLRRLPVLALATLVLTPLAAAQSAGDVLDRALATYERMYGGVEDYTVVQRTMGQTVTMYHERRAGSDPAEFETFVSLPGMGLQSADEGGQQSTPTMGPAVLARMKQNARYLGTETVAGTETHAIAIDDFDEIAREFGMAPPQQGDVDVEMEAATMYLGADDGLPRRIVMTGTMTQEGQTSPYEMQMDMTDYRTVEGLHHPFRTTITMTGMDGAMSAEDRAEAQQQLDEARRQMEQMPAEQRAVMERMMGDQLKQLEEMLSGGAFEMEMEVQELRVNAGRPQ